MEIVELVALVKAEFPTLRRGKSRFGKGSNWSINMGGRKACIAYDVELSCEGDTWRSAGLNSGAILGTGANINADYHLDSLTGEKIKAYLAALHKRVELEDRLYNVLHKKH